MRVAGDDALDAERAERLGQRRRELPEQHLVADPAHALAGRAFGGAEDAEADAARCRMRTKARAIFWPRGSNDIAEPT